MEDSDIIEMFWARNEQAIYETHRKYGKYCYSIAFNILGNREDADECVNDTYLGAWKSIPPSRPEPFAPFLSRIARNTALKKYRTNTAHKRKGSTADICLEELEECIPANESPYDQIEVKELLCMIEHFLKTLEKHECDIFICRYWYFDSISQISKQFGFGQSKVKMILMRTRNKLRQELEKEGISV